MPHFLCILTWEINQYGADVVAAFGEYCGQQKRIILRVPRLGNDLECVSHMVQLLMRG